MRNYNLISSRNILGELNIDYNINDSSLLAEVPRHIARGIELMELSGYFRLTYSKHTIEENRVPLPCNNKNLIAAFISSNGCISRLPLKTRMADVNSFFGIPLSEAKTRLDGNYLITEQDLGLVGFIYYSIPIDEENMPLIPDNPFVLEALPYFIIFKLSLSGYKHPIISFDLAEIKWNEKYPRARNNVNYPTVEEMAYFTQSNTFPYFDRLLALDTAVQDTDVPVFLSQDLLKEEDPIPTVVQEITNTIYTQNNEIGWIVYTNLAYTSLSPYTGDGSEFTVPIGDDVIDDSQATDILKDIINGVTHEINVGNLGDAYIGRLDFKLRTSIASRTGNINFDIGGTNPITFNNDQFLGSTNAGEEKDITLVLPFYQLATFAANNAEIKCIIDGDFEMYDIILYLNKVYHGSN